jgi:hypothetical protein
LAPTFPQIGCCQRKMSWYLVTARPLHIELRALGVTVHVQDTPDLGPLDYGLVIDGLNALSDGRSRRLRKRIMDSEEALVKIVLDRRDPDLHAIRSEASCTKLIWRSGVRKSLCERENHTQLLRSSAQKTLFRVPLSTRRHLAGVLSRRALRTGTFDRGDDLREEGARPHPQELAPQAVLVMHGEDHHSGWGRDLTQDQPQRFPAPHDRHRQVQDDDIRLRLPGASLASSTATAPFSASPITSMFPSVESISARPRRNSAWSSASTTLMGCSRTVPFESPVDSTPPVIPHRGARVMAPKVQNRAREGPRRRGFAVSGR